MQDYTKTKKEFFFVARNVFTEPFHTQHTISLIIVTYPQKPLHHVQNSENQFLLILQHQSLLFQFFLNSCQFCQGQHYMVWFIANISKRSSGGDSTYEALYKTNLKIVNAYKSCWLLGTNQYDVLVTNPPLIQTWH